MFLYLVMCCLALYFSCALFSLEGCQIKLYLKIFRTPPQGMEHILLTSPILRLVFPWNEYRFRTYIFLPEQSICWVEIHPWGFIHLLPCSCPALPNLMIYHLIPEYSVGRIQTHKWWLLKTSPCWLGFRKA